MALKITSFTLFPCSRHSSSVSAASPRGTVKRGRRTMLPLMTAGRAFQPGFVSRTLRYSTLNSSCQSCPALHRLGMLPPLFHPFPWPPSLPKRPSVYSPAMATRLQFVPAPQGSGPRPRPPHPLHSGLIAGFRPGYLEVPSVLPPAHATLTLIVC